MGVKRQQDLTSSCTVVLLGDARAGKTAMVNRLLTDKFSEVRFSLLFLGLLLSECPKKWCSNILVSIIHVPSLFINRK